MLTAIQKRVIHTLGKLRDQKSYMAGGAVLNAQYPRISDDLDIFVDNEAARATSSAVVRVAQRDMDALKAAGFLITDELVAFGFAEVTVRDPQTGYETKIQWMEESAHRFFPLQSDPEFGWRLHDVDLAVNKAVAAASRRQVRDIVDLDALNSNYLHLGSLVWAASESKTPMSPLKMLENILHNAATHSTAEYKMVRSAQPVDGTAVLQRIRTACEEAQRFCREAPVETIGHVFVDKTGKPASPTVDDIRRRRVQSHGIHEHGAWPSFPDAEPPAPST